MSFPGWAWHSRAGSGRARLGSTGGEPVVSAQLAEQQPETLADLDPTVDLWAEHVEMFATGHRSADREHAVCGAPVLWPIAAAHLMRLCGQLCPLCWPQLTTQTSADRPRKG